MASLGSFIISAASSWANGGGRPGSGFADQVAGPSAYLRVCSSGAEHSVCDSTNALCRVVSRASSGVLRRRCGDPTFRARVGNARQRWRRPEFWCEVRHIRVPCRPVSQVLDACDLGGFFRPEKVAPGPVDYHLSADRPSRTQTGRFQQSGRAPTVCPTRCHSDRRPCSMSTVNHHGYPSPDRWIAVCPASRAGKRVRQRWGCRSVELAGADASGEGPPLGRGDGQLRTGGVFFE